MKVDKVVLSSSSFVLSSPELSDTDAKCSIQEQLLHRNVQRFRGELVFKADRLCVSLSSRLERNTEDKEG